MPEGIDKSAPVTKEDIRRMDRALYDAQRLVRCIQCNREYQEGGSLVFADASRAVIGWQCAREDCKAAPVPKSALYQALNVVGRYLGLRLYLIGPNHHDPMGYGKAVLGIKDQYGKAVVIGLEEQEEGICRLVDTAPWPWVDRIDLSDARGRGQGYEAQYVNAAANCRT